MDDSTVTDGSDLGPVCCPKPQEWFEITWHPPLLRGHSDDEMRFYSAKDGQEGGGVLIFDDLGVHAIPAADSAWREATKGQRKEVDRPLAQDGSWKLWFLLTRALVLNGESLVAGELELAPADSADEAARQLKEAAIKKRLASESRQHAMMHAFSIEDTLPIESAMSERAFIDWFGSVMAGRLAVGDFPFIEAVTGFARIAKRMPRDIPAEVNDLCKAIAAVAVRIDGVPTKREVRSEMKKINLNYDDEERLRSLRKRAGFQWLPEGKPGPK